MTTTSVLPLPRPVLTAIAGFAAVVLLVALIYTIVQVEHHRSVDSSLKSSAERALRGLQLSGTGYDNEPTFYRMYQRFVYDERSALVKRTARSLSKNQWAQIVILETNSAPPQDVLLNMPKRPVVQVDTGTLAGALQQHHAGYTTTHLNGKTIRAYLVPIPPPQVFNGQNVFAALEVFENE